MIYLGIDTSNYKTSIAAVDDKGKILCDISEYLEVRLGERGLRQSEAFFKHSNKLPKLFTSLLKNIDVKDIAAVAVSEKPRRLEDSYMPCFLAGINLAEVLSQALDIPLLKFSHQEGHAAAIIESGNDFDNNKNLMLMHLSGGTTEILNCKSDEKGYSMNIIGGTLDISIGQLLDRFGVALGFPFPSGMFIDELASKYSGGKLPKLVPGIRITDGYFNLSGPETVLLDFALKYTQKYDTERNKSSCSIAVTEDLIAVCYEIIDRIADVLLISSNYLTDTYRIDQVCMAGGVASSETLRNIISSKHDKDNYKIVFGDPKLSGDNAVGTALLARRIHKK